MINWDLVNKKLIFYLKANKGAKVSKQLKNNLNTLYNKKNLSVRELATITGSECSTDAIRRKLHDLNIAPRPRGGANNKKLLYISEEEFNNSTTKALATKYKVSSEAIRAYHRQHYGLMTRGRPKPTSQESLSSTLDIST